MRNQGGNAAHDHHHLELAFIVRGEAVHHTVNGSKQCSAGDILSIPSGVWHAYTDGHDFELYNCLISPEMLNREIGWISEDPILASLMRLGPSWQHEVGEYHLTKQVLSSVKKELTLLHKTYYRCVTKLEILASFLKILSYIKSSVSENANQSTNPHLTPLVKRSLELFASNWTHPWRLNELAAKLNVHPGYLVRQFTNVLGQSPMKYLALRRGEKAATLLLTTELSISEIGQLIGWEDPKHFARSFHRQFGSSAKLYRATRKHVSEIKA